MSNGHVTYNPGCSCGKTARKHKHGGYWCCGKHFWPITDVRYEIERDEMWAKQEKNKR